MASSVECVRMLVSCLPLVGFTSISCGREASPMIMPSYTSTPGPMNSSPRFWRFVESEPRRESLAVGDDCPAAAVGEYTRPRHPTRMVLMYEGRAACCRHEQRAEPEQPASRCLERHHGPATVSGPEIRDLALSWSNRLGHCAYMCVRNIDDRSLQRLVRLTIDLPDDDFGPTDL